MKTTAHVINHTHWDREWFLTSIYTSQWIPGLINKLEQLVADNPNFTFLFDGQTLVIEDLLQLAPDYEPRVRQLIKNGNLIIGPYYCQPDWQITGGELLLRNLLYGQQDMQQHEGSNQVGWLVDTFGHISQSPQLHRMFGLEALFVWRGVPELEPYFHWRGGDGQELLTINLFGGYRNLYGVTHASEVAITRLAAEVDKLQPYYPTPDVPLFDGYDLEEDPEDPMQFYQQHLADLPANIDLRESSPHQFAQTIEANLSNVPTLTGELNSGKYGATFPGTFSARTYLKIMQRDCEQWLFQLAEPLAVLARLKGRAYPGEQYEAWARLLLQNSVHDCLCGVSIDQVHEKMEHHYRQVYQATREDVQNSLAYILGDFAAGTFSVSTNPFPYEGWLPRDDKLYHIKTNGIGVWPAGGAVPIETPDESIDSFHWQNDYYEATVQPDGTVRLGQAKLGYLVVSAEAGDTYSDELGARRQICRGEGLVIEQQSEQHTRLRFDSKLTWDGVEVTATIRLTFDSSPLLRWQVDLASWGTDFRVDLVFETAQAEEIYAGMQFDVVKRPVADTDLLPRQLEPMLTKVLLGQRELGAVYTFPFHDFIAISDGTSTTAIFAKGLRSYQADEDGTISLTLRRSVEWLTAADLEHRIGDAGPFFYVPDARCERTVRHELAVTVAEMAPTELELQRLNAGFQNPPLIVNSPDQGQQTEWQFLQEDLPLSSLHFTDDKVLARLYNPTLSARDLPQEYASVDTWGQRQDTLTTVGPKQIVTVELDHALPPLIDALDAPAGPIVLSVSDPTWRVGDNQGLPDPEIIAELGEKIDQWEARLSQLEGQLEQATGRDRYVLQHKYYVVKREMLEYQLSKRLNELKLGMRGQLSEEYLYTPDEEIRRIGLQLNRLRIKRRIYDYVVEAV